MKNLFSLTLVCFVLLLTSCSKNFVDPTSGPIGCDTDLSQQSFDITIQDKYVTLPGQVSVFFKVDDIDGRPIAGLNSTDFAIFEKGRNDDCFKSISAFEANARISPNSQIFQYNTMLVLDLSGSVLQGSFNELKSATLRFIDSVMPRYGKGDVRIGIWWFDGEDKLHELQDFTGEREVLISKINKLDQNMSNDSSTDLYGAVIKSAGIANNQLQNFLDQGTIAASSVILFTDGTDQAARYTKEDAFKAVNNTSEYINFYTIGLGNELDTDILAKIGKSGSIIATDNNELEEKFNEAADLVFDEANSFYLFEYCSPKRDGSGTSELVLQVDLEGVRGYAQTSFDATGFVGGCD